MTDPDPIEAALAATAVHTTTDPSLETPTYLAAQRMFDAITVLLISLASGRLGAVAETQRQSLLIGTDLLEGPEIQTLSNAADGWKATLADIARLTQVAPALLKALQNCVDYWPSALNDDLQKRTLEEARALLEEFSGELV